MRDPKTGTSYLRYSLYLALTVAVATGSGARASAVPAPHITCQSESLNGVGFAWCTNAAPTTARDRVLYLFSNRGSNQQALLESKLYHALQGYWSGVFGVREPLVISVSFGPEWTLTRMPSAYLAGHPRLLPFFVEELMPYLERKVGLGQNGGAFAGERYALGVSIGAFNALQIVSRYPDRFARVALLCPALMTVGPYASTTDVSRYVARTGASAPDVATARQHFFRDLDSAEAWDANDPLRLAEWVSIPYPPMLVLYNTDDKFGFEEGARRFAALARAQGASVDEASNAGGHCLTDFQMEMKLAEFFE